MWDCRIVLSNCYKLNNYGDSVSCRRVFDRLTKKAEHNGSVVTTDNDVFITDDVRVYSMKDGPVHNA